MKILLGLAIGGTDNPAERADGVGRNRHPQHHSGRDRRLEPGRRGRGTYATSPRTGTFTNIVGQFFTGYEGFLKQHEVIFEGRFKQTKLQQDIVSLKFVRPDVAVVEVLTSCHRRGSGAVGAGHGRRCQGASANAVAASRRETGRGMEGRRIS